MRIYERRRHWTDDELWLAGGHAHVPLMLLPMMR